MEEQAAGEEEPPNRPPLTDAEKVRGPCTHVAHSFASTPVAPHCGSLVSVALVFTYPHCGWLPFF